MTYAERVALERLRGRYSSTDEAVAALRWEAEDHEPGVPGLHWNTISRTHNRCDYCDQVEMAVRRQADRVHPSVSRIGKAGIFGEVSPSHEVNLERAA